MSSLKGGYSTVNSPAEATTRRRSEVHTAGVEVGDQGDDVRQGPAGPVELHHHEGVAGAGVVEPGGQLWTLGSSAGRFATR